MNSKFKKLATLLTAACMSFTAIAFAACEPEEPETPPEYHENGDPAVDGYNVTVLYPDGKPVKGSDGGDRYSSMSVTLIDENGELVDPNAKANVNEAGIAQINYHVPGEYFIKVNYLPSGYVFDEYSVKTTVDRAYYNVSLEVGPPTAYLVTLIDPDGTPMNDIDVKLMDGDKEIASATTNANGIATTPVIERGAYNVVMSLPDGLGCKPTKTGIGLTSIYPEIVKLSPLLFDEENLLDEEGIAYWDDALNFYYPNKENPQLINTKFNTEADCYAYDIEVGENSEIFYTITAPKTGAYTIGSKSNGTGTKNTANYKIQFYTNDLSYVDTSLTISSETNNGNNVQSMRIIEGEKLTFSIKSADGAASNVELLVCLPVPEPEMTVATAPGTFTLNYDQEVNEAIVRFTTSQFGSGVYEINVVSDYDVKMTEISQTGIKLREEIDLPYVWEIKNSEVGGYTDFYFIIKDEDVSYPTQITCTITKTAEAHTEITVENTVAANVTKPYADQTGTFTWMPYDGSVVPYERNGLWYVNISGVEKPLVVAITKNLLVYTPPEYNSNGIMINPATRTEIYSFSTIEYFGEASGEDGSMASTKQNSKLTISVVTTSDTEIVTTKTDYSEFIKTYSNYVNSDGVYQVNTELKEFLDVFMDLMYYDFVGSSKPNEPWLIACGYYA